MFMLLATFGASQSQINDHLEKGRELLARGQLQEALSQYHAAVGKYDDNLILQKIIISCSRGGSKELPNFVQKRYCVPRTWKNSTSFS